MEDTCLCGVRLPATGADATYTGLRVFGVFDGHNGPEVSHWVGQRLAPLLEERGEALAADLPSAMRDAFAAVDNEVLAWCEREGVFSGATATVAVLADKGAGAAPVLVWCVPRALPLPLHYGSSPDQGPSLSPAPASGTRERCCAGAGRRWI